MDNLAKKNGKKRKFVEFKGVIIVESYMQWRSW